MALSSATAYDLLDFEKDSRSWCIYLLQLRFLPGSDVDLCAILYECWGNCLANTRTAACNKGWRVVSNSHGRLRHITHQSCPSHWTATEQRNLQWDKSVYRMAMDDKEIRVPGVDMVVARVVALLILAWNKARNVSIEYICTYPCPVHPKLNKIM